MKVSRSDKLIITIAALISITFFVLGAFIIIDGNGNTEEKYEEELLNIARIVASDETVVNMLIAEDTSLNEYINSYYVDVPNLSSVVVMDMQSLVYSHPDANNVLKEFVVGDELNALNGETYISNAKSIYDDSMRAFVPVYNEGTQIGVISVGILRENIVKDKTNNAIQISAGFGLGLVVTLIGLVNIRSRFKTTLQGFTPSEFALLYADNLSIIEQLDEGVISIDDSLVVLSVNKKAKKMFNLSDDIIGQNVEEVFPFVDFKLIIDEDKHIDNKYKKINEQKLLMNAFPLYLDKNIIGASAIFRSHLEVDTLVDQIQGYQQMSEALRSQKHEFQNKLHVVLGLIKMKDYLKAENYIMENVYTTNIASDYYSSRLKDDRILALFVGKEIQSKGQNTSLLLTSDSYLSKTHNPINSDDIVLVLGNLIDNSFDAYKDKDFEDKRVVVDIFEDEEVVKITVIDQAGGIDRDIIDRMFERGISSKQGDTRGTGLSLVNEIVSVYSGVKNVTSSKEETKIEIILEKVIG